MAGGGGSDGVGFGGWVGFKEEGVIDSLTEVTEPHVSLPHTHTGAHTHARTHVRTHTHAHTTHARTHARTPHTRTHTHTHTHTHARTHTGDADSGLCDPPGPRPLTRVCNNIIC